MTNSTFIKRHQVLIYFVLTLVISWVSLLLIMGVGGILGTTDVPNLPLSIVPALERIFRPLDLPGASF